MWIASLANTKQDLKLTIVCFRVRGNDNLDRYIALISDRSVRTQSTRRVRVKPTDYLVQAIQSRKIRSQAYVEFHTARPLDGR